ncbi:MAG: RNA polymerase sigma factor [Lysobacteraceae bacterium]
MSSGPTAGRQRSPTAAAPDPDLPLVQRLARGDQQACALLLDRHLDRIHGLACRLLGDPAEAEDIAQETFLRAWRLAPDWQPGRARFSTWLHRVALNLCHDRLRRRRPEVDADATPLTAGTTGPEGSGLAGERADRVAAAVAALPGRQREAIVLRHYQELSQREAAEVMAVSEEALESLLARARRSLRQALADEIDDEERPR